MAKEKADALIALNAHGERLEGLPRTGWMFGGVVAPESIAAHSYNVALVAMGMAQEMGADVGRTVQLALVHDLVEAQTTDIPGPIKGPLGVREGERRLARELGEVLGHAELIDEWLDGTTLEARIVKAADQVQMVAKACQYHRQHRGDVRRFLRTASTGIPLADATIERLLERSRNDDWDDLEYGK